jgi:hypothetical protein
VRYRLLNLLSNLDLSTCSIRLSFSPKTINVLLRSNSILTALDYLTFRQYFYNCITIFGKISGLLNLFRSEIIVCASSGNLKKIELIITINLLISSFRHHISSYGIFIKRACCSLNSSIPAGAIRISFSVYQDDL